MKKITALILLFLILFLYPAGFCQDEVSCRGLSLKEAIQAAYQNNKDIQIQEAEVKVSEAEIIYSRSKFLPKLDLNAGYTHKGAVSPLTVANTKKDMGVFAGYVNQNDLGFALSDSVYNGGADWARFKQSRLDLLSSKETLRAKKLDVEFEAKRLYYGLLLAIETERIAQELLDNAKAHFKDVESKFNQGTSSQFDYLQSKVQVSKLVPDLVNAQNTVQVITAELNKLIGFNVRDAVRPKEQLVFQELEPKEKEFLTIAYLNKPEMILKSLGIDISKWSIEMAKAGWRPQVNLALGYKWSSNNNQTLITKRHGNWNAGFAVTVPIFDSFSTRAKVDEARSKYEEAVLEKGNVADQVAVDIRRGCLDLLKSKAIIDAQRDSVWEAEEANRISIIRYDNGVGTNLDVLDAEVSLADIRKNLAEGIYDYIMAQAFLERTMGTEYLKEEQYAQKN